MSFWSKQTATAFCFASFGYRDLSDWLVRSPLADASPAAQLWLGRVLPGALIASAAAVDGLSRIVVQRHYFSDTVIGAGVGAAAGWLAYSRHFDRLGRPRVRRASERPVTFVPLPGGFLLAAPF
jgi:membrane-associated phospholipid phosphatase